MNTPHRFLLADIHKLRGYWPELGLGIPRFELGMQTREICGPRIIGRTKPHGWLVENCQVAMWLGPGYHPGSSGFFAFQSQLGALKAWTISGQ